MKVPIIVFEDLDVIIFSLIESAEAYLEPIDVENGEYLAFDAEARPIELQTYSENKYSVLTSGEIVIERVKLVESTSNEPQIDAFSRRIRDYLASTTDDNEDHESYRGLLDRLIKIVGVV